MFIWEIVREVVWPVVFFVVLPMTLCWWMGRTLT